MMLKTACSAFLVSALTAGCAASHGNGFLDATIPIRGFGDGAVETGAVMLGASGGHEPFPVRLQLLATDRGTYRRMETLVYDLRLVNTSKTPVVLPWSPHPIRRVDRPPMGYRHAMIELVDQASGSLGSFVLYGSPNVPNSLKRLAPGESVVVRVPAVLSRVGDGAHAGVGAPAELKLQVKVSVYAPDDPLFRGYHSGRSDNALSVRIAETIPTTPAPAPYVDPPEIVAVSPLPAVPGTVIRLEGFRLGVDRESPPTVQFVKNGSVLAVVPTGGFSYTPNNRERGPQSVVVTVPGGAEPGEWQVVVDASGRRSRPFPVLVQPPTAPRLERLWPAKVNPGSSVTVWGAHFRDAESHEILDASGRVVGSSGSSMSGDSFGFIVPADATAGEMTVRVRARTTAGELTSNSLPFVVTSDPLPVEVWPERSPSVAPGQWMSLYAFLDGPLRRSHRTEIEFEQKGRSTVVTTIRPASTRVRIPKDLAPGPVNVRTRTWHEQKVSPWSDAKVYQIAPDAVPVAISALLVGPSRQYVNLSDGPDRPARFEAIAGDELHLRGDIPVENADALRVSLEGVGVRARDLVSTRGNDDYSVAVRLPRDLPAGSSWQLVIRAPGVPDSRVPITMHVSR